MSIDGFLASSTTEDLSFHSWVRHNRGIALGQQVKRARPSSRDARDSDRVTCRMVGKYRA